MRLALLSIAVFAALLTLAYRLFALEIFNFIVPKDGGTVLVASDVPFGGDPQQKLDIYSPEGERTNLPVLVFIHGGSWDSGAKDSYEFVGRAFAARGYLTLVPNYRKRPAHPYPAFVEDAALALAFAQDKSGQFGGDGTKIYAVAHSAGAYNLALAVLDRRYLLAAGVEQSHIKALATLAGPFDFLPLDTRVSIDTFGQVKDLPSTQPVNYARADAPPMLLLTGTADTTVRPRNSEHLQARLKALGAKAEIRQYHGVGHVGIMLRLARPLRDAAAPVLDDVAAFFAEQAKAP